jgi:hypothetical protein
MPITIYVFENILIKKKNNKHTNIEKRGSAMSDFSFSDLF